MKQAIIGILGLAIIAGGVWLTRKPSPQKAPTDGKGAIESQTTTVTTPEPTVEKPRPQSKYYSKPEETPAYWGGFYELSQMKKLNKVTTQMHVKEPMDPELYGFFKAEMFNRDHWDVTRNNMANALVWTRNADGTHPDPNLHEAFIDMLEDENEDPVWRDYCLQFLSEDLPNSSDPKRVTAVITKYSKGDGKIAGTASIHMALQEQYGGMKLDEKFNEQLAEQLEKPEVHAETKLSIIGVMGKRKDIKRLPLIRKYAKQDQDAGLKRVAIAAIGTIGGSPETRDTITDEDKAIVKAATKHKNGAVVLAAQAALKRLETH